MISVLRTKFLAALLNVAPPGMHLPDAADCIVRLQAVKLPDQFLDTSFISENVVRTVGIPCRGDFSTPWEVVVRWLPLYNFVAAEDHATVLQLDRGVLCLLVHAGYANGVFQEDIHADEKANPGSLPQQ